MIVNMHRRVQTIKAHRLASSPACPMPKSHVSSPVLTVVPPLQLRVGAASPTAGREPPRGSAPAACRRRISACSPASCTQTRLHTLFTSVVRHVQATPDKLSAAGFVQKPGAVAGGHQSYSGVKGCARMGDGIPLTTGLLKHGTRHVTSHASTCSERVLDAGQRDVRVNNFEQCASPGRP